MGACLSGCCARGPGRRWCWSANDAFISPPPTRRPSLLRSYGPATSPQGGGELKCVAPERGAPLTPPHPDPLPQGGRGQYGAKRHHSIGVKSEVVSFHEQAVSD